MRRSEITPELIKLSKQAKELGFPQDVEVGDWVHTRDGQVNTDDEPLHISDYLYEDLDESEIALENPTLILSFSRCLKWLEERVKSIDVWLDKGVWYLKIPGLLQKIFSDNRNSLGVKAVVKILEEEK